MEIMAGVVEEHVAKAAASDDADDDVGEEVLIKVWRDARGRVAARDVFDVGQAEDEGDDIGDAVPVHADGAKVESDGVEVGIHKHGRKIAEGFGGGKVSAARMALPSSHHGRPCCLRCARSRPLPVSWDCFVAKGRGRTPPLGPHPRASW